MLISKAKTPPRERRGFAGSGTVDPSEGFEEGDREAQVSTCGAADRALRRKRIVKPEDDVRRKKKTMANVDVVNLNGEKVGSLELADAVFGQVNEALLWEAVKHYRASQRQGTHETKNRNWSPVPARSCGSRRARAALVLARCARRCGATAARCTDPSRAATTMPFRARSCWARCARRWLRSWPTASSRWSTRWRSRKPRPSSIATRSTSWASTRTALLVENGKTLTQWLMLGARNLKGVELVLNNEVHPYDLLRYERAIFSKAAIEQLTEALQKSVSKRQLAAQTEAA